MVAKTKIACHDGNAQYQARRSPRMPRDQSRQFQGVGSVSLKHQPEYRSIVGNIMWLALNARSDLAVAANTLRAYVEQPTKEQIVSAERVLRCLKSTHDKILVLKSSM